MFEQRLSEPTLLYIVDGPVQADGYDWFQVAPFERDILGLANDLPFGWVAAGAQDGEPWIAPAQGSLDCPEPDLEGVRWLSKIARLACFRGETLQLEGEFGDCVAAETPVWLLQSGCMILPFEPGLAIPDAEGVLMRTADGVDFPFDSPGIAIVATGHFDDPAASTCSWAEGFGDEGGMTEEPPDPALVILMCRSEFVITDLTSG